MKPVSVNMCNFIYRDVQRRIEKWGEFLHDFALLSGIRLEMIEQTKRLTDIFVWRQASVISVGRRSWLVLMHYRRVVVTLAGYIHTGCGIRGALHDGKPVGSFNQQCRRVHRQQTDQPVTRYVETRRLVLQVITDWLTVSGIACSRYISVLQYSFNFHPVNWV